MPEKFDVIETPYGRCVVQETRPKLVCIPVAWELAEYSASQPRFYLNDESISQIQYKVGDRVWSQYGGEGEIIEVREQHFVVTLKNWQLADGKSPTQYLQYSAIIPLENRVKVENVKNKAASSAVEQSEEKKKAKELREGIDMAAALKVKAAKLFKGESYGDARQGYLDALELMNKLGYEMPDHFRAEVLEHTIPCHNNIALCCMKDKKYEEAKIYANNGVMLVEALEGQISKGKSKVWEEFKKRGMSLAKLTKDWKKKSLFYKGKACLLQRDYEGATENFEKALVLVQGDESLSKQAEELSAFLAQAKKLKAVAEKKEKATWQKAFKNNTKEGKKEEVQVSSSSKGPPPGAAPIALEKTSSEAKVDISKFVKGGTGSSSSNESSSGSSSSKISTVVSSKRDDVQPAPSPTVKSSSSSSEARREEVPDVTKEDNLTMYLLGGAVALALGIGALSLLTRKK